MIYLPPPAMTRRKKHKGFNLIEAAIVLGIVGLVIGGIWAAATTVMRNHRAQQTVNGYFIIAERLNKAYSRMTVPDTGTGVRGQSLQDMGMVPDGWSVRADGLHLRAPFIPLVSFRVYPTYISTNISIGPVAKADCIAFTTLMLKRIEQIVYLAISGGSGSIAINRFTGVTNWTVTPPFVNGTGFLDPIMAARVFDDYCGSAEIYFPRQH